MMDMEMSEFQMLVDEVLTRNRSLIDVLSKMQDTNARANRAITKAVTQCGCISLTAQKQVIPEDIPAKERAHHSQTHVNGTLCPKCREAVEKELGGLMFYLASLCNVLDLSLFDITLREQQRLGTLGRFHLR